MKNDVCFTVPYLSRLPTYCSHILQVHPSVLGRSEGKNTRRICFIEPPFFENESILKLAYS
jgi:hypothetical protein